jgi:rhodanese-related sulfurtransferase
MEEIVEDYESGGRDESQYCIIDVRTEEEIRSTGKISENVYTLPVQVIMQSKVFDMDPDEFEEFCKFPKPTYDETIVFTCAAGMRSVSACHFAAQSGYTKLINYTGGANEWFSPSRF